MNTNSPKSEKKEQLSFWQGRLAGVPVLELPTDYPRPKEQTFAGGLESFKLSAGLSQKLETLNRETGTSLFIVLLTAFNVLLYRYSGQTDIAVGTPAANRGRREIENPGEFFVNMLVMRADLSGEPTFEELLSQVRDMVLAAYSHRDLPFELLVDELFPRRDLNDALLFRVMFSLQDKGAENPDLPGLTADDFEALTGTSKCDLSLLLSETDPGLKGTVAYNADLFDRETIVRLTGQFTQLLGQMVVDPRQRICDVSILSEREKRKLLVEFNDTVSDYPADRTICDLFEEQANKSPDDIAVFHESSRFSYRELNRRANRLTGLLREKGVEAGVIVGIMEERSIEMVVGILGILKAGGAYLPVDIDYPARRTAQILKDSAVRHLLTRFHLAESIDFKGVVVRVDEEDSECGDCSDPDRSHHPLSLAYVMYTSGTTGRPKGILVENRSVVRLVKNTNYIRFKKGDRILQTGALAFDASTFEIWGSLLNGLTLCLVDKDTILSPENLKEAVIRYRVSIMWMTVALFNRMCDADVGIFSSLGHLLVGGDVLSPPHINRVRRTYPGLRIINGYGPTENTTFSTTFSIDREFSRNIPIGSPIANSTAYVVDRHKNVVPIGVTGELYVGGDGVARGYLNNPELTADKFASGSSPFCKKVRPKTFHEGQGQGFPSPGGVPRSGGVGLLPTSNFQPIYKTGDQVRWLNDGNIEFSGRFDQQVKIRGFRIELGEIEAVIGEYPGVAEVVVLAREDAPGEKLLTAYVVRSGESDELSSHELGDFLQLRLPPYMVPPAIVELDALPLTPNGKVDRRALPSPDRERSIAGGEYVAPGNPVESRLAAIWCAVLGLKRVGIYDNFFKLGGHSLQGAVLLSQIHKEFSVKIPLGDLFTAPTVKSLSGLIKRISPEIFNPIKVREEKEYYGLSSAQKRLYILNRMEFDSTSYNIPVLYVLEEKPDVERLGCAFRKLIERHESFRTSFEMVNDEPVQRIHRTGEIEFEIEHYDRHVVRPFDLSQAPLLRAGLITSGSDTILAVDMHHIISDGTSMEIFAPELAALYDSQELAPLALRYKDYARWQNENSGSEALKQKETYWLNEFSGELPTLELPYDYSRSAVQSFAGDTLFFRLGSSETAALKELAGREGTTLFMILSTIFNIFLTKLSGKEDIIIGSPAAGRDHPDLDNIIGMFVNTVVIRSYPAGERPVKEYLQEMKQKTIAAFENQEYQFDDLVEKLSIPRDTGRNPLFDVMFVLLNMETRPEKNPGLKISSRNYKSTMAKFDLTLTAEESAEGIDFNLGYCSALFKPDTIDRFTGYFKNTVSAVIASPGMTISGIEILSPAEKNRVLSEFNDTACPYPAQKTAIELFEEQVERTPQNRALTGGRAGSRCGLTYREFNEKCNRIARYLRAKGIGPDLVVGILLERSIEMIAAIYAVLKAGAAYLPIAPDYPPERIRYMLSDSGSRMLLTREEYAEEMSFTGDILNMGNESTLPEDTENLETMSGPNNLVYTIYTSGSTGRPKGAMVKIGAFVNLLHWYIRELDITNRDCILLVSPISFDLTQKNLFASLQKGGSLSLSSPGLPDYDEIADFIFSEGVTIFNSAPSVFYPLIELNAAEDYKKLVSLRCAVVGGESLQGEKLREWLLLETRKCRLLNAYGPTECTGIVSYYRVDREEAGVRRNIPIGKPIPNVNLYILNRHLYPVPVGVTGEICIGGVCVSRGYMNNPELTAEKFASGGPTAWGSAEDPSDHLGAAHPFTLIKSFSGVQGHTARAPIKGTNDKLSVNDSAPFKRFPTHVGPLVAGGDKLYKTGDLGRWLDDGNIEFLGRVDFQVKVRGNRIELGEIESCLLSHPAVQEVVVSVIKPEGGENRLCAYFVPAKESPAIETDEFREHLAGELPDYMIPDHFVELGELPLTPSGKVDRRALPEPEITAEEYAPPRDAVEELVAGVWCEVLGLDRVGRYDHFFRIGGHSLLGTQVISRICKIFNKSLPLKSIFEFPTVSGLAARLSETADRGPTEHLRIEKVSRTGHLPLSFAQQRLWFLDRYESGSSFYNIPIALRFKGNLDVKSVELTLSEMIRRHESLRTIFLSEDGRPYQEIVTDIGFTLEIIDLENLPVTEREADAARILDQESGKAFDLSAGPLFRAPLLRLDPGNHILLLNMHHIISDGWSVDVLFREFEALYRSFSSQEPCSLADLLIQYADFTIWQRKWLKGDILEKQLSYWKEQLSGVSVLELPTDNPRPKAQTFRGALEYFELSSDLSQKLLALSRETGATLFMVLLAAFKVLLVRYTGQVDIAVGSPIANRNHREVEDLVGFFVNTLVLRTDMSGEPTFKEVLSRVRNTALGAYSHQDAPFEMLVDELLPDRDMSRPPLFQVMFSFQDIKMNPPDIPGLGIEYFEVYSGTSKFDLNFHIAGTEPDLKIEIEYNLDLFNRDTIERLTGHFEVLLEQVVSDPEQRICDVSILSKKDKHRLIAEWNDTDTEYSSSKYLHELFEEQAGKSPDNIALFFENRQLTYRELNNKTNQLAKSLRNKGVIPGTIVGVMIDRSIDALSSILGVLKAGGAYLPIAPDYPDDRKKFLLADSRASLLLNRKTLSEIFILAGDKQPAGSPLPRLTSSRSLCYIIYTSGSTGQPKGIPVEHTNAVNVVEWFARSYNLGSDSRLMLLTDFTFDPSVEDSFGILSSGGTLFISTKDQGMDRERFRRFVDTHDITIIDLVPTLLKELLSEGEKPASLKVVISGGEKLEYQLKEDITGLGYTLYNHYGPTETSIDALTAKCTHDKVKLGKPIANAKIYILDKDDNPVPIGVPGEICISGTGVTRGYLNKPSLTAEKFIPDPYASVKTARMYRTGDSGRWLADGTVEFLGRMDDQVKIRGFRIELGEIKNCLMKHKYVRECIVLEEAGELAAYIVLQHKTQNPAEDVLRQFLLSLLPAYMVPAFFIHLDAIPLLPNGKVDINALPDPDREHGTLGAGYIPPRNAVEELLAGIWSEVLSVEKIGVHDNFFNLGGHSLLATQVVSRICRIFKVEFPLQGLFEYPTLANLSDRIERITGMEQQAGVMPIEKASLEGGLPLSFAQQRLWFLDQFESGSSLYNIPVGLRLTGRIDANSIECSLTEIIRRHENLRTIFLSKDGQPYQEIVMDTGFTLEVRDLENLPVKEREAEAAGILEHESRKAFDLSAGPLFRALLLRLGPENHILLLNMHHIISDGWSVDVLFREFGALYRSFSLQAPCSLVDLPIQYADFANWQREWLTGEVLEQQLSYWKEQLSGVPALELPLDFRRPQMQTFRGELESFDWQGDLPGRLSVLSRETGTTLFMVLLAAFKVLMVRYSGQEDIAVGSPIANRNRREIEDLVGFFVNTLVLRTDMSGEPTFKEVLSRVRDTALGAYSHQDVPFEMLVDELLPDRDMSRTPLFQVVFTLHDENMEPLNLPGVESEFLEVFTGTSKFDLSVFCFESDRGLAGEVAYNIDLFDRQTIVRLIGHFEALLGRVAADPGQRICDMSILSEKEKHRLLVEFNDLGEEYPGDRTIHGLFVDQADKTPNNIALVEPGGRQMTYEELHRESDALAVSLKEKGVAAGVIVGLITGRSINMMKGILGILKAGGAYLPLNPKNPAERNRFMLEDCNSFVLLACADFIAGMKDVWDKEILDLGDSQLYKKSGKLQPGAAADPAYVIYTSGSTGMPKGVVITHANFSPLVHWGFQHLRILEDDRALQNLSYYFDWSVWEIFLILGSGASLYFADEGTLLNGEACIRFIWENNITVLHITPTHYSILLNEGEKLETLKQLCVGAEKMSVEMARRCVESVNPGCRVYNMYGPTEVTIISAVLDVDSYDMSKSGILSSMPIGKTVANNSLFILDKSLNPVPLMVTGELVIAGEGVSQGYLNNPELTSEKFASGGPPFCKKVGPKTFPKGPAGHLGAAHHLNSLPKKNFCSNFFNPTCVGERLAASRHIRENQSPVLLEGARAACYKTGDLARWLPDGTVEFLGRGDTQVKIRGLRIELGEIESKVSSHDRVAETVVIVREDEPGNSYLCAYIVCGEGFEVSSLRDFLSEKLPDYMIPSYFVQLQQLPLNPNGKIDLRALPEPGRGAGKTGPEYIAPRNAVEESLARIWSEVLNVKKIGIDDNFFNIGGHSLLATQVVSRICRVFNVEFPLQGLFECPTLANLSDRVEKITGMEQQPGVLRIEKVSRTGHLPLSFAQQRLWFLDQYESGSSFYNIPVALCFKGHLDVKSVERSLDEIIRRHESFRTIYLSENGQPYQEILPNINFSLEVINIENFAGEEKETEAHRILQQESIKPFDLTTPPLFCFLLLRLDTEHFILLLNMHHIISDGWSLDILLREFETLYRSFSSGEPAALTDLPIQYADFATWQRQWLTGEVLDEQLTFWEECLAGVPVLELPTDYPRPRVQTFRGEVATFELPAGLSHKLTTLSQETGTTLFMVLLAAFDVLLHRYTGQADIAVGSPIANRSRRDIEGLIGFFVNTLVMRTDLNGEPTFKELLSRVREMALTAYSHQDIPFEMLVDKLSPERDLSYTPLFQVIFSLQSMSAESLDLPGLECELVEVNTKTSKFDLSLFLSESDSCLKGVVEYNVDLFSRETVTRMTGHFALLLEQLTAHPEKRIGDHSILSESEKQQLLVEFNDLGTEYPREKTIHGIFVEQAAKSPGNVALVEAGSPPVTYKELNRKSETLAFYLREKGVSSVSIVGLLAGRSIDMVTGILGILKAGGAYLPLNPKNPAERNRFMLADCNCFALLAGKDYIAGMREVWDKEILDLGDSQLYKKRGELHPVAATDPAYVIYTSGSTGIPKGVVITHANFSPLVNWGFSHLNITADDRALQNLSYYFDWSVWEIFLILGSGASLYFADEEILLNGKACIDFIREKNITVLHITPTQYSFLLNEGEKLETLKQLCIGAEKMSVEMARRCLESVNPGCRVYNMYGPTEVTIISAVLDVDSYDMSKSGILSSMPIGYTVGNNSLFILDKSLNPVPLMVTGELVIAGEGVSRGYVNNPELTSEKFANYKHITCKSFCGVQGQFFQKATLPAGGNKSYKTGDLARWLPDGTIEFLGRGDTQVKIRGFRIEPGEIESAVSRFPGIADAVVIIREDVPGEPQLVAYVVPSGKGKAISISDLRDFLHDHLPDYMVPSAFVELENLPLNPNGKVDRKSLQKPSRDSMETEHNFVAPRTSTEETIVAILSEVLNIDRIGIYDNFFNLGGHSLIATQVVSRIQDAFQVQVSLQDFFRNPKAADMAKKMDVILWATKDSAVSSADDEAQEDFIL